MWLGPAVQVRPGSRAHIPEGRDPSAISGRTVLEEEPSGEMPKRQVGFAVGVLRKGKGFLWLHSGSEYTGEPRLPQPFPSLSPHHSLLFSGMVVKSGAAYSGLMSGPSFQQNIRDTLVVRKGDHLWLIRQTRCGLGTERGDNRGLT